MVCEYKEGMSEISISPAYPAIVEAVTLSRFDLVMAVILLHEAG